VYTADRGEIRINGEPVVIRSPQDAKATGIGMVFQEFSLIPTLSVAQNIFLAHEPRGGMGLLNDREAEQRARALFNEMNVDIDPRARVSRLSTGYWQLTEIAKALSQNVRVLILDEPTAALAASETQALFHLIRTLKAQGISMIYISHRMEEIFQIADRVTVMRDGHRVVTASTAELTMAELVELIVGRKMEQSFTWEERPIDRSGTPLLEVHRLNAGPRVQNVSFQLYAGEILGLAGLMGSGRTELVRALFGIDRIRSGQIAVRGKSVTIHSPEDALKVGMCLVPEDRRAQGLVLSHTVKDNTLLPLLNRIQRNGIINDREGNQLVESYVESLQIKTDSIHKVIRLLSGGNQQKVVIAKWLASQPVILLMDEPTAGVDIGAKTEIRDVIRRLADEGKGVIVVSSEFTELLALADRVLIIRSGMVTQELDRHNIENEESLEQAVQRTSAKEVQLSPSQLEQIRAMNATAAIDLHYSGDDWSAAQVAGLQEQFAKMGIEVIAINDANFDPQKQVANLESVLAQQPNIIVSVPTDPVATIDVYKKAAAQGIKLIFMDNVPQGLIQGSDYISVVSSDNYGHGITSAHLMAEHLKEQGAIALLYHATNYQVTRQRYDAFKRAIQENYPHIQVVEEQGIHGPNFAIEAEQAAGILLENHPELKGIWAVWDIPAEGVITAIQKAGRTDVIVTTIDLGKRVAVELACGGVVKGISAQRPYDHGVTEAI
ncbi:hypothetical protein C7B61_21080, partial [filamentous cyanobacterium CCP1]